MFRRLHCCFYSKSLSSMIKLFLILNKGTCSFPQKVSAFVGSFFNNFNSQAFLRTWEYLFLERLHLGRTGEAGDWEDNVCFKLEMHPWFFPPCFLPAVILSISTNRKATRQMPWAEELKEKIYNSLFINRNYWHKYDSQDQLTVTENQMLAFAKCKRGKLIVQSLYFPHFNDLSSFLDSLLLGFRNSSFWLYVLHQKLTFKQKSTNIHSQFSIHLSQYVITFRNNCNLNFRPNWGKSDLFLRLKVFEPLMILREKCTEARQKATLQKSQNYVSPKAGTNESPKRCYCDWL